MSLRSLVEQMYARRLSAQVRRGPRPAHVGLIMDGNRRWARSVGLENPSLGHRVGGEHMARVLGWCQDIGIDHVTIFVCSTENLARRGDAEVAYLMQVIEEVVAANLLVEEPGWRLHLSGVVDAIPASTARALKDAVEATRGCSTGRHLTLAIGYGGRREIVDAVRALLWERGRAGETAADLAETLTDRDIAAHLYTPDQPDVDLIVRTSGEQRLSNFLLWQTTRSELFFADAYWPAFRQVDLLRALRTYGERRGDGR